MMRAWRTTCLAAVGAVVLAVVAWEWPRAMSQQKAAPQAEKLADVLLAAIDSPGGFCIHLGANDGQLTTALSQGGKRLVHGLAGSGDAVDAIRAQIRKAHLEGIVSVQQGEWKRLPYADRLANLIVVEDFAALAKEGLAWDEVQRVLQPGGVVWVGGAAKADKLRSLLHEASVKDYQIIEQGGAWAKVTKPKSETTDQWTHKFYDASGNPASKDTEVGVPTGVRWVAGPQWPTGYRKSAVPGVVATDEHLVYIFQDEIDTPDGKKPQDVLIARDVHNGLMLWKRLATKQTAALAAVGDRVYAVLEDDGPLVAVDVRTGKLLTTFAGTKTPKHVIVTDKRLLAEAEGGLACYDAHTGEVKWVYPAPPSQFVSADDQVYLHTQVRDAKGKRQARFVCVDLDSGEEKWQAPTDAFTSSTATLLLAFDGTLVASSKDGNHGLSARDGSHLWTYKYPTIGHGGSYLKVLAMHDLVWVHTASAEGSGRYAWEGLDPQTGKVKERLVQPPEFKLKHRCSYDVATSRMIMCGSMDFADFETGDYQHFSAARNSCQMARVLPANGLLYSFPHGCGCYPMLRGFLGLESHPAGPAQWEAGNWRLVLGPAYGQPAKAVADSADGWPTYRRDPLRTGSSASASPDKLELLWSAQVASTPDEPWTAEWDLKDGGRLSSPVASGELAVVAASDDHTVHAINVKTGKTRWTFTAAARIDCPPTLHDGYCLLGSRDGYVYCLRADDGKLVWRFCAAPRDERIVAFGQLESKWPVVGGVLVYDGLAYFAVGRHANADGGITVCAVEPATGKLVWSQKAEKHDGLPDVLTAADGVVQMASFNFDAQTGEQVESGKTRLRGGRLGLLNDAWYKRPIAMRRNLQQWQSTGRVSAQMMAFHENATCGFLACDKVDTNHGTMFGDAALFAKPGTKGKDWSLTLPQDVRLRGIALTADRAYVAGLLPTGKNKELAYMVQAYSLADGKLLAEGKIGGSPVHDGVAIADGRVYISLQDGRLLCFGEK